jgi:hypothetical protein
MIDVGDYVHHGPSNEDWVVAAVDGDRLYWCGWPFGGSAELSDCTLIKKAAEEKRDRLIRQLAESAGSEIPIVMARQRLKTAST